MRRLASALCLLAVTGCVSLPESGPVTENGSTQTTTRPGTFDYNPELPKSGDQPGAIVAGFLDALRETPLTFAPAKSFLTKEAALRWEPGNRTIVYEDGALEAEVLGSDAVVRLESSVQLDARGSWLGDPSAGQGVSFPLHLVREADQWRIADPPDALIVSRTHFDTRFVRYALSFFDPSGRVVVPEPVYVPIGDQAPDALVSGLLAGPDPALASVERSYIPVGTRLASDRVTVEDGVAHVPLSREILDTDSSQLELALAQLAWTLRQLPGITKMRVTVDGNPVDSRTGASARSLDGWASYDSSVPSASSDLYAFRGGDVVAESDGEESLVSTAFDGLSARSLGVSLSSAPDPLQVAAVSADGRRVYQAEVQPVPGTGEAPTLASTGLDVLRPDFDLFGNIWLLDRADGRARLAVVQPGGRRLALDAPGISDHDVTAFELSRDGTRLAALVDGSVVMARVSRAETGRPTAIGPAVPIQLAPQPTGRLIDLAWTTPATVGVLVRVAPNISLVQLASVDGSFGSGNLEPLFERATDLVTRPGVEVTTYLATRSGRLYSVSPTGRWELSSQPPGLIAPTFAG